MNGWPLRGAALVGAIAALAWAHLAWWVHRSDLAADRYDWEAAARDRGVAAALAPFVPGGAVELLPPLSLSRAAMAKVLPGFKAGLASAVAAAPYDYQIWSLVLRDGDARARAGAVAALTQTGRGIWGTWLEAGNLHLSEGKLDAAVAAYREGVQRGPRMRAEREVRRRLLASGAPLQAFIDAMPPTEQGRAELVDELMRAGDPDRAVTAARKGLEEFPRSKRMAAVLRNAEGRLRSVNATRKESR